MPTRIYRGRAPKHVPFRGEDGHPEFRLVKPNDVLELSDEAAERLAREAPGQFVATDHIERKKWRDLR